MTKTNKLRCLSNTGRYFSILSPPSNPPTSHALRNKITARLHSQHLPLSTVQAQTFHTYNTNTITLFKTIHNLKLYPTILSFSWRLLHKTLHFYLHLYCPFCHQTLLNSLHFFSTCPVISTLLLTQSSLSNLLSPPHHKEKTLFTLITLWAIWKLFTRETHEGPLPNDARSKVLQTITSNKLSRVKLAHSQHDVTS